MKELKQLQCEMADEEYLGPGQSACPGCSGVLGLRHTLKIIGGRVAVVVAPGCSSAVGSYTARVPVTRIGFASGGAVAAGVKAGFLMRGDTKTTVLLWAGDGGIFDIGLQALSAAAERGDDIICVCFDNEAYMNTGIQRSSATPRGTWTTTTPGIEPKKEGKKNIMEIMAGHRIPYAATASLGYPRDFIDKINKAKLTAGGLRFIHLLGPCPTGWRFPSELTIKISRLAVQSRIHPLYEVEQGYRYSVQQPADQVPVRDYLKLQGRFSHLTDAEVEAIQKTVDFEWKLLMSRASLSEAALQSNY